VRYEGKEGVLRGRCATVFGGQISIIQGRRRGLAELEIRRRDAQVDAVGRGRRGLRLPHDPTEAVARVDGALVVD
jgi:hypothetical protein